MKALLFAAFFALTGIAFGQVKINTNRLKTNTEKKVLKPNNKKKKTKGNSLAPGTNINQTNRKRPGGTLNNNSNSRTSGDGDKPKKPKLKKEGGK